jgi:hypothetical protein
MKRLLREKNLIITRQEDDLSASQLEKLEFARVKAQIVELEDKRAHKANSRRLDDLEGQLVVTTRQNAELMAQQNEHQKILSANEKLEAELATLRKEHEALETLTQQKLSEFCGTCELNSPSTPDMDLDGVTIVYVGGRTGHIGSFKALVEEANGAFLHHDGGLEDSDQRLTHIMSSGDIVMCPMDCVSHQASLRAKKYCKYAGKKFVPLRSSGLSSFITSLQDFSHPAQ